MLRATATATARRTQNCLSRRPAATGVAPPPTARPIFSWIFGGSKEEDPAAADDNALYEVRAYHHNEHWTPDTKARYCDDIRELVMPNLDVKAFYVKAGDDEETRVKASAGEILSGELPTEDDGTGFPTVVWVAKHESKDARDETFGAFIGSEAGQKFIARSPFNLGLEPQLLQGYEKIEEHFFRQPLSIIPNCVDPDGGKIHEVRTYYFPLEAYSAGDGKAYEDWAKGFFADVIADPLWKDKVRVLWTRGFGENAVESNYTSGPNTMDPENHPFQIPEAAAAAQPCITWACQWDSVEEKDAAWEKLFGMMPEYFGPESGNPQSKTGQLEGYKKLRIQFMESLI